MFKIALDAGHGMYTPGKRCLKSLDPNETREWYLNARICDKIEKMLKDYDGYALLRVDDTTGQTDVPLKTRTNKANSWGADFYLSVHHDAGLGGKRGGGTTVYVYTSPSAKSVQAQNIVYEKFIEQTGKFGNRSDPTLTKNLHVVREAKMPSVLIECAFMDSPSDVPMLLSDSFAEKAARGLTNALVEIGGLTRNNNVDVVKTRFPDINGHYAEKHINKLIDYCIINGYEDGTFKPDNNITRAEFAKIIVEALEKACGYTLKPSGMFPDTVGHWAEMHIKKLIDCGIVNGFEDGTFKPDNAITRGQASIVASNMLLYCGVEMKTGTGYPDTAGHYAERHIASLNAFGIVNGYEDGMFKPDNNITRGQAAIIIANCLTVLGK